MSHVHVAVWLDHNEAKIFHVTSKSFEEATVHSPKEHTQLHRKSGSDDGHRAVEDERYYHDVAKALGDAIVDDQAADDIAAFRRIQFTPDLLPSDITGTTVFDPTTSRFFFRAGPIFAHVLLADEINRTSPKVQAALLEAMGEKQTTIDNRTRKLDELFFVIATQNPLDLVGTFPLPAAQLDRFAPLQMDYLPAEEEVKLLAGRHPELARRFTATAIGPDAGSDVRKRMQETTAQDILPFITPGFTAAAMATVGTGALESRQLGYLLWSDTIVPHKDELLFVAIQEAKALHTAGYRPPAKRLFPVGGRSAKATIQGQLINMRDGGFISEHDFHIASLIAGVVTGGEVDAGTLVSEEYLMQLERQAFGSLLEHPKTQARIMAMLQDGKPLRN